MLYKQNKVWNKVFMALLQFDRKGREEKRERYMDRNKTSIKYTKISLMTISV